jgi:hypothetical protein
LTANTFIFLALKTYVFKLCKITFFKKLLVSYIFGDKVAWVALDRCSFI